MTALAMKTLGSSLIPSLKNSQLFCTTSGQSYLLGHLFGKWQFFSLGADPLSLSRVPLPIWSYDWVVPAGERLLMYCLVQRRCILWCPKTNQQAPIYGNIPRGNFHIQSSFRDESVHIWMSPSAYPTARPELMYGKFSLVTESLVSPFEQILEYAPTKLLLINDKCMLTWSLGQQQIYVINLSSGASRSLSSQIECTFLNAPFANLKRFVGITRCGSPLLLVQTKDDTRILNLNAENGNFSTLWNTACKSVEATMSPNGHVLLLLSNDTSTELHSLNPETHECSYIGSTSLLHSYGKPVVTTTNQLYACDWKRQSIISIDLSFIKV